MNLDPLTILLMVLVVVAVWAVVELALTIRKARSSVDEITRTANDTIEQVQPIISKLDGAMDDLQPALKQADPLVAKVDVALDGASVSISQLNEILADVSSVSGTAAGVTETVSQVASSAASSVSNMVNKITGKEPADAQRQIEGASAPQLEGKPKHAAPESPAYGTYAPVKAEEETNEKDED